ncbi:MAG: ribonuclease Z [Parachlamydiaceae bacterium]|nr:ribonuclease Z [Parachlamydiaceae bacterium]
MSRDLTILGCSSQQPTRYRNHGAYLLRWNNEGLLFDPGEGTQRQFIFANIAPTCVTRIFISHFHGDHCLGLGSMLMRLNLDQVPQTIHCYFPASGQRYFDRLRYCAIYHDRLKVVEHPVAHSGLVEDDGAFRIEAAFLEHGVDNIGWRISEHNSRKFEDEKLDAFGIKGLLVKELLANGKVEVNQKVVTLEDVSWIRKGDVFAYVVDTLPCQNAIDISRDATMLMCESTYLNEDRDLARRHNHLTAEQAALIAREAGAKELILTHFSARYLNLKAFETEARKIFPNTFIADDFLTFQFKKTFEPFKPFYKI